MTCRFRGKADSGVWFYPDEFMSSRLSNTADELRNAGYTVPEASNADEALEVLRHTSKVALVFTDLRMPGSMDGVKFAGFVRSEHPVLKIVLTSGDLAALDRPEHDGFFPKPYDGGKVIQHIKALLTEERANSLSRYPT
jgi:two-component system, response regulator PdtaR